MGAVVPSQSFDFSKYQAGDVIVLRFDDYRGTNMNAIDDFVAMIMQECRRRGIGWTMDHNEQDNEWRITLHD